MEKKTAYDQFFIRSYPGDTNMYPKPVSCNPALSPDIIPVLQVEKNPQSAFLGSNFEKVFGNNIEGNAVNYFYVRGKNYASSITEYDMKLYWSKSTMLMTPSAWKHNALDASNGSKSKTITLKAESQGTAVTDEKTGLFYWEPPYFSDSNKYHYCLISHVVPKGTKIKEPDEIHGFDDFVDFLRAEEGMGYAMRNTRFFSGQADHHHVETISNDMEEPLIDGTLELQYKNIPNGSRFRLTSPQSKSKCYMELEFIVTGAEKDRTYTHGIKIDEMEEGFEGEIHLYLYLNGQTPPAASSFKLNLLNTMPSSSRHYPIAQPIYHEGYQSLVVGKGKILTGDDLYNAITPTRAISIGSCEYFRKEDFA